MTNDLLLYTRKQVSAFLEEIERLKDSEFPYPHSRAALVEVAGVFANHLNYLDGITPKNDPKAVRRVCDAAVDGIGYYLPLLGFILRSTNVRNAFEIYGPVLQLARQTLGSATKLVISSEWKYSPFMYGGVKHLPGFVFIGLPAPESANPFLVPLAGHELGHSLWAKNIVADPAIYSDYIKRVTDKITADIRQDPDEYVKVFKDVDLARLETDLIAWQTWQPALHWGLSQMEECFCDFVGLRLFGKSYLYALSYLLSPMHSGQRPLEYPNTRRRISYLKQAASRYLVELPLNYEPLFEDLSPLVDLRQRYLVGLADAAADTLIPTLIGKVHDLCTAAGVPNEDSAIINTIHEAFRFVTPGTNARCLADIVNAAWNAFHDETLWSGMKHLNNRDATLKELVLKSIEVFEVEQMPPL